MGLFTDPVTLSKDGGTTTTDFAFGGQYPDTRALKGVWVEEDSTAVEKSQIIVKHDLRSSVPRALLQRTVSLVPTGNTDGVRYPITLNFTCVANEQFTDAQIQAEVNLLLDAMSETDFVTKLRLKMY